MSDTKPENTLPDPPNLNEVLLTWKSPSHPFKKRNRIFYQTVAALTFLLVVIVFFLHEFMLIGVILSIAFVVYVISSVPPVEMEHKITRLGITQGDRVFRWMELAAFWFEESWGQKILVVQTHLPLPSQLRIVLGEMGEDKVKEIFGKYLLFLEKPPKNFVDNVSDWLAKKIPLETTS